MKSSLRGRQRVSGAAAARVHGRLEPDDGVSGPDRSHPQNGGRRRKLASNSPVQDGMAGDVETGRNLGDAHVWLIFRAHPQTFYPVVQGSCRNILTIWRCTSCSARSFGVIHPFHSFSIVNLLSTRKLARHPRRFRSARRGRPSRARERPLVTPQVYRRSFSSSFAAHARSRSNCAVRAA